MRFSVIVPTYHDWDRLAECLEALSLQSIDSQLFEIIVVNNSLTDQAPPGFFLPQNAMMVLERKPGSYVARNTGASLAKGNIYAFTDSDCIPAVHWLENAYKSFSANNADLLGGKIMLFQEVGGSSSIYRYERATAFRQEIHVPQGRSVTANLFVRSQVFKDVGGFDPELKSGGDWEFTQRCVENGYVLIYADKVIVRHPARRDLSSILKKQLRLTCWGTLNVQRKYGHSQSRILLSNLYNGVRALCRRKHHAINLSDRLLIFTIDLLKLTYKITVGVFICIHLIDPRKVRE